MTHLLLAMSPTLRLTERCYCSSPLFDLSFPEPIATISKSSQPDEESQRMRTAVVRSEIQRLIRQAPFRPFVLNLENGDRITIEHPENIAFDPDSDERKGSRDFYVISGRLRMFSTFDAVSDIALADTEGHVQP